MKEEPTKPSLPDATIETLARGFFREASIYGFTRMDYVRFVNTLLDSAMAGTLDTTGENSTPPLEERFEPHPQFDDPGRTVTPFQLPVADGTVGLRLFDAERDRPLLSQWVATESGRYFLLSAATARQEDLDGIILSDSTVLGIITFPNGSPAGVIAYLNCDRTHRKAELRKLLGEPTARGKGLGRAATRLWIRYAKSSLGLRKIYLNTLDTNIRNIRLNEELGFKIEGILRNEVLIDGTYRDVLRMGLWLA